MKTTDINRIRYEVERQIIQAIDKELEELNRIFTKRANQYHQILFSEEAKNIAENTYGLRWQILREKRQRLALKASENWNASGEVLKKRYENGRRLIELNLEQEVEE